MDPMTKKVDPIYYLNYEMDSVVAFLKKRFSKRNSFYLEFVKWGEDYSQDDIDSMGRDEKRLDSEIRLLESIVSAHPFMDERTDIYLPELYKLKKKYQSLRKKAIKALEEYEKQIAEEKQSD